MSLRTLVCEFQDLEVDSTYQGKTRRSGSPGRYYEYLYTGSRNVKAGDWALVHNGTDFGITKIIRVKPGITDKVAKHVITVVTQNDFALYLEANKSIVSHREVFDELDYMLEHQKKLAKYEQLAEENPYAKSLLEKLHQYNGPSLEHIDKPFSFDEAKPTVQETLKESVASEENVPLYKGEAKYAWIPEDAGDKSETV